MYRPMRRGGESMWMSDWAAEWLGRNYGFESKVYDVAGFDPIRFREITESCTLLDIIKAWKTKMALSDYAWNDRDGT